VVERAGFRLDVTLRVAPGETVAVLGPNGAGKTTLLRALAGLVALGSGSVRLGGTVLADAERGVSVPPHGRGVGFVFQDYLLFQHLSALDNVAFGCRARHGLSRRAGRMVARPWLERLGLAEVAGRRPGRLSGGQAQRVALARALAPGPGLLLLDEPLAALDAGTRVDVRAHLRAVLADLAVPSLLVTHDPLDALTLADRVLIVEDGQIAQQGEPVEIARRPRTDYVARLMGLTLYQGVLRGDMVAIDGGGALRVRPSGTATNGTATNDTATNDTATNDTATNDTATNDTATNDTATNDAATNDAAGIGEGPAPDGRVLVAARPAAITLHTAMPAAGPEAAVVAARVAGIEPRADGARVALDAEPPVWADLSAAMMAELRLAVGVPVWARISVDALEVYPAARAQDGPR
jgi:molybdate transport system ATP-binding protein